MKLGDYGAPRNDLSRSFCCPGASDTYHCALNPDGGMKKDIQAAELAIRHWLGVELPRRLRAYLPQGATITALKFRKQGSWAYGLLNDPLRSSTNFAEADSDLGVYLPVSTLKSCTRDPGFAADLYLDLVEGALEELATRHQAWSVARKSCCIRVQVRFDAHVDVTCYAVPEADFAEMAKAHFVELAQRMLGETEQDLTWDEIPNQSLLATKDGWSRSDAKAIHECVENAAALHGSAFKRVVRYVKGARDVIDDPNGPCSIAVTLILARQTARLSRDDLDVLTTLGHVADGLLVPIPTPGNEDVDILGALPQDERARLSRRLRQVQQRVSAAIFDLSWTQAHDVMRNVFGSRFPTAANAPAEENTPNTSTSRIVTAAKVAAAAPAGNVRSA